MNDTVPRPTGLEGEILKGINWAITQGCHIISMSIGGSATVSSNYNNVGNLALSKGSLIIAAAGNDSNRARGVFKGVTRPANSQSIMAVAAIDSNLQVADFSNRGLVPSGGQIDIAAPGVDVYSSYLSGRGFPPSYITINGTSMATPHVAGIAALIAEKTGARGMALWAELVRTVNPLSLAAADVGAGLVQAP